jgi:hypothetical protein
MILIYLTADGRAKAEFIKHASKFIELPDGYHPMLDKGVLRDSAHKYPSVMMVWQNRFNPENCPDSKEDTALVLIENELIKMGRGRPTISKMFFRRLLAWLMNTFRWFYFGFFLLLVLFMSYGIMAVIF